MVRTNWLLSSYHKLSTLSLQWMTLFPSKSESGAPLRKVNSGMVSFKHDNDDMLYVVAGYGPASSYRQVNAQYYQSAGDYVTCNEQHVFSLRTSELYTYSCMLKATIIVT